MAGTRNSGRRRLSPEAIALRRAIGRRLVELAADRHPYHRGRGIAQELSISYHAWWRWTAGDGMPGHELLRIVELTGVEPGWLLHGTGPRYRDGRQPRPPSPELMMLDRALRRFIARQGGGAHTAHGAYRDRTSSSGTGADPERR